MNKWSTKPLKMWIDGKTFNIKPYDKFRQSLGNLPAEKDTESSMIGFDNNFIINSTDGEKLVTKFRLPLYYYIRLNNFPNFNKKSLEQDTQTEITIPRDEGYLTISGSCESNIVNARELIHSIVGEVRETIGVEQFIAIPVHSEEVQMNFKRFKEDILSTDLVKGIDASIFQSPLKLHLTIAVFSLLNEEEKNEAVSALHDCKTQIIGPILKELEAPVKIKISGIDCMKGNLSKTNVLYANAKIEHEGEDVLQKVANGIADFFYDRGLIRQYRENVKLHVTLLNTRYQKDSSGESSRRRYKFYHKNKTFDARNIIEKYRSYYFGDATFDSIHLSSMKSIGEDGFYKSLAVVSL